jgi:uncharacterized protein (DUF1330 family)
MSNSSYVLIDVQENSDNTYIDYTSNDLGCLRQYGVEFIVRDVKKRGIKNEILIKYNVILSKKNKDVYYIGYDMSVSNTKDVYYRGYDMSVRNTKDVDIEFLSSDDFADLLEQVEEMAAEKFRELEV